MTTNVIPIFQPELPPLAAYTDQLEDIWASKMVSNFGDQARKLESIIQNYLGTKHARVVTSGDMGLLLALKSLDLEPGDEVIVPSFTFNSTVNAIVWNGLQPVFADINPKTLCIDPADIELRITPRTKAILGVHVFGNPCDVDTLKLLAKEYKLKLLFDSAHAYGSKYRGKKIGGWCDFDVFSLSGTKLVTSGEGGIVATNDEVLIKRIDYLRNFGFQNDYDSQYLGLNGKMSEFHAALGALTLPKIDAVVSKRNKLVKKYITAFSDVPQISFQEVHADDVSAYKDFCILVPDRDALAEALTKAGIMTKKYFFPIHQMQYYQHLESTHLKNTNKIAQQVLCIPLFNTITAQQQERVITAIKSFFS